MTAVAGLWDLLVRAWLVAAALLGLRRPARMRWLTSIGHPVRFVRAMIVPSGRHFALAIAFLPRARRDEASVSFLICKALDAFEDLSPDRAAARAGLTAAADYFAGRAVHPPRGNDLIARRESDRLEALLAARLPLLLLALEALPAPAVARCRALIDRIATGMLRADADRRRYADDVLGEAVTFAASIAAPGSPPPPSACRAAGRALQLANDLRDAETARGRAIALYRALPELPIVPRLLRWLPAGAGPGARAAATLLAATTCVFYLRQVAIPGGRTRAPSVPPLLRHPLRAALRAAISHRRYLAAVAALDHILRSTLLAVAGAAPTLAAPSPSAATATTCDAVASAETLLTLAMDLVHTVPASRLDTALASAPASSPAAAAPGRAIILADYLLFAAIDRLAALGPDSVSRVAELLEQLALPADRAALSRSTELADFVGEHP